MSRFKKVSHLGISSLFIGQCFLLTGCDQEEMQATLMKLNRVTDSTEEESQPHVIHVDSSYVESEMESGTSLEAKKEWISQLIEHEDNLEISNFLQTVDEQILKFLVQHGTVLEVVSESEMKTRMRNEVVKDKVSDYDVNLNKIIISESSLSTLEEQLNEWFYHEVGHVVHEKMGQLAATEGFYLIFEEGKDIIFPESQYSGMSYRENSKDYFTESFNLFFKNPAQLTLHEETYKYICNVVEKLYEQ